MKTYAILFIVKRRIFINNLLLAFTALFLTSFKKKNKLFFNSFEDYIKYQKEKNFTYSAMINYSKNEPFNKYFVSGNRILFIDTEGHSFSLEIPIAAHSILQNILNKEEVILIPYSEKKIVILNVFTKKIKAEIDVGEFLLTGHAAFSEKGGILYVSTYESESNNQSYIFEIDIETFKINKKTKIERVFGLHEIIIDPNDSETIIAAAKNSVLRLDRKSLAIKELVDIQTNTIYKHIIPIAQSRFVVLGGTSSRKIAYDSLGSAGLLLIDFNSKKRFELIANNVKGEFLSVTKEDGNNFLYISGRDSNQIYKLSLEDKKLVKDFDLKNTLGVFYFNEKDLLLATGGAKGSEYILILDKNLIEREKITFETPVYFNSHMSRFTI